METRRAMHKERAHLVGDAIPFRRRRGVAVRRTRQWAYVSGTRKNGDVDGKAHAQSTTQEGCQ
eukprot:770856-Pleurochrysis_carterae.AAC.1